MTWLSLLLPLLCLLAIVVVFLVHLRQLKQERAQHSQCVQDLSRLQTERDFLRSSLEMERTRHAEQVQELQQRADNRLAELKEEYAAERQRVGEHFALVAREALDEQGKKLEEHDQQRLKHLVDPVREALTRLSEQMTQTHERDHSSRTRLETLLETMNRNSQTLTHEAKNLADALKGESKTQGDWGEVILERILEESGLVRGQHFLMQDYITNGAGERQRHIETDRALRPDATILLPDDRVVYVDAKVSLTAAVDYAAGESEEQRTSAAARHLASVLKHIDELSRKDYSAYQASSPDFVLLFFPNEAALSLALSQRHSLWVDAYRKKILLVGPANLVAMLMIISDLWKRDSRDKELHRLVEAALAAHDKFVLAQDSLDQLSKHIDNAKGAFDKAYGQLYSGKGNMGRRLDELRRAGGLSTKKMLRLPAEEENDGEEEPMGGN